ncbi:hypothetical protein BLOT_005448 [Blomia tropicalis]|nr:hypothetical protein BLOT_005448 [Blomia tropicalis]
MAKVKLRIESKQIGKNILIHITHFITTDETKYKIPYGHQLIELHEGVGELKPVKSAIRAIRNKPGHYRSVKVDLESVRDIYLDEHENPVFNEMSLEPELETETGSNTEELQPQLNINPNKKVNEMIKNSILEKYNGRADVKVFIDRFEIDCTKHGLNRDEEKIDALGAFLDEAPKNWYDSTLLKLGKDDWQFWVESMKAVFGKHNWDPIRSAYYFRYIDGRYIDYVLKKEKLLLEVNKDTPLEFIINMIVMGLPTNIQDKLERGKMKTIENIVEELTRFEKKSFGFFGKKQSAEVSTKNENINENNSIIKEMMSRLMESVLELGKIADDVNRKLDTVLCRMEMLFVDGRRIEGPETIKIRPNIWK